MTSFYCLMLDIDIMMKMPVHPRRVSGQYDMPDSIINLPINTFPVLCYGLHWFLKVIFRMTLLNIIWYQF